MKILGRIAPALMRRRIALGFVTAMVLIASGFIISFYSYYQYGQDTERVRHYYEVINSLDHTLSLVKDVETGGRGFIISKDKTFLESYYSGLKGLPDEVRHLRSLVGGNALRVQYVAKLERLIQDKLAISKARIAILPTGEIAGLRSGNLESKRRMDLLRRHVDLMISTERSLMEVLKRQASRSFRNTLILIFGLFLLTCMVLAVSYRQLKNELARRQETEDQLRGYEVRLREQIRQLEASNEELERFAFVASHDLQEPLRKIQSFAALVMDRYGDLFNAESQLFMNKIIHSAERMSKLIKDLLNFSRMSSNREDFKPVHLNAIVQRILDDQELRIRGLNVRVDVGPLPMVQAVSSQLEHLFANLISNALKFLRPGIQPMLRIRAKSIDGDAYPELVEGRPYVEITVEDNGIGFDEKYLDHIFKVFQRLHGKNEFEGTGIGLAICKRVVVYHHGFITARSHPNQGTTFLVILPQSQLLQDYDRSNSTEIHSHSAG